MLGADALEDQVAGNLEDTMAEEEHRRPQRVGGSAEPKVADHLQLGIGDILPVDIGDQIEEAEERHQPPGDASDRRRADVVHFKPLPAIRPPRGDRIAFNLFRSEEHTSELQSLMRTSYAVFCLTKKN